MPREERRMEAIIIDGRVVLAVECTECKKPLIQLKNEERLCLSCGIIYSPPRPGFVPLQQFKARNKKARDTPKTTTTTRGVTT